MTPTDDCDPPQPGAGADERLAADLASLRPAAATAALRARIAAELAGVSPAAPPARVSGRWRGFGERLAWAAAGAVAASLAMLLFRGERAREQPAVAVQPAAVATTVVEPERAAEPSPPLRGLRVSEEPVAWSDEGIRFLDGVTPARILRRRVVERHLAPDGQAEVRVPREDVIFLPVALR
jgi:hypothetical protein